MRNRQQEPEQLGPTEIKTEKQTDTPGAAKRRHRGPKFVDPKTGKRSTAPGSIHVSTYYDGLFVNPETGEPDDKPGAIPYRTYTFRRRRDNTKTIKPSTTLLVPSEQTMRGFAESELLTFGFFSSVNNKKFARKLKRKLTKLDIDSFLEDAEERTEQPPKKARIDESTAQPISSEEAPELPPLSPNFFLDLSTPPILEDDLLFSDKSLLMDLI